MLIGGAVGLLGNFVGSLAKTKKSTEDLQKAFNDSAKNYKTSSSELNQVLDTRKDVESDLTVALDGSKTGTQEQADALKRLNEKYPNYVTNIDGVISVTKDQASAIKALLELEEQQAKKEVQKDREELEKNTRDLVNKTDDITEYGLSSDKLDALSRLSELKHADEETISTKYGEYLGSLYQSGLISGKQFETQASMAKGKSQDDLIRLAAGLESYISKDWSQNEFLDTLGGTVSSTDENGFVLTTIGTESLIDKYNDARTNAETVFKGIAEQYGSLATRLRNDPDYKDPEGVLFINQQLERLKTITDNVPGLTDYYHEQNAKLFEEYGSKLGIESFATGLESVPYDNFPAVLHKNEMVLTEETATKIRNMNDINADISSVINSVNLVSTAIDNQTVQILQALNEIYNVINNMSNTGVSPFSNNSVLNNIGNFARG